MAEQSHFSPDAFLAVVQQQLGGLDAREQREILEELRNHLEDAAKGFAEAGTSRNDAMTRAIAEMGDPSQVGRQLRREHMAKSLPWRCGLLAVVPLFTLMLYSELWWPIAFGLLFAGGRLPSAWATILNWVPLIPILGVAIWDWRKGYRFLIAPFAGIVLVYSLFLAWAFLGELWRQSGLHQAVAPFLSADATAAPNAALKSWLVVGPWAVAGLAFLPVLALLAKWGRLAGSLALLGGIGAITAVFWIDPPITWLKVGAYLGICVGLVAFVSVPRRHQLLAAWAVLVADWALVALGKWYFIVYEAPHAVTPEWRATHLPTLAGVWSEMPLAVLVFSLAMLLCIQLLASARATSGTPIVTSGT